MSRIVHQDISEDIELNTSNPQPSSANNQLTDQSLNEIQHMAGEVARLHEFTLEDLGNIRMTRLSDSNNEFLLEYQSLSNEAMSFYVRAAQDDVAFDDFIEEGNQSAELPDLSVLIAEAEIQEEMNQSSNPENNQRLKAIARIAVENASEVRPMLNATSSAAGASPPPTTANNNANQPSRRVVVKSRRDPNTFFSRVSDNRSNARTEWLRGAVSNNNQRSSAVPNSSAPASQQRSSVSLRQPAPQSQPAQRAQTRQNPPVVQQMNAQNYLQQQRNSQRHLNPVGPRVPTFIPRPAIQFNSSFQSTSSVFAGSLNTSWLNVGSYSPSFAPRPASYFSPIGFNPNWGGSNTSRIPNLPSFNFTPSWMNQNSESMGFNSRGADRTSIYTPSIYSGSIFGNRHHNPMYRFRAPGEQSLLNTIVRRAIEGELHYNSVPTFDSAFERAKGMLRLHLGYDTRYFTGMDFSSIARTVSLSSSYNRYHPNMKLRDLQRFAKDIGGVASESGIIKDLMDSETHATAEDYVFCFPAEKFQFPNEMLSRIKRELQRGYFEYKTLPFFSLHFNNDGVLYPVLHQAYENTLIGFIIAFLDYWMKCYLNGGFFDLAFLEKWPKDMNCDEAYLRSMMVDLKKYAKKNLPGLGYISLRELQSRYDLDDKTASDKSAYQMPFMTSFRIIAYQKEIQRHGNVLLPQSSFKVEYTIEPMPDYQEYIDSYKKEHGTYPPEYKKTRQVYELYAEEIKEKMPKLPFCQQYFQLLSVVNSLCYFYSTLEKMGKRPVFEDISLPRYGEFPKAFPPIPVRYFRTFDVDAHWADFLKEWRTVAGVPALDATFKEMLLSNTSTDLPQALKASARTTIERLIRSKLADKITAGDFVEINEEEVDKILNEAISDIKQILIFSKKTFLSVLSSVAKKVGGSLENEIRKRPLLEVADLVITELRSYREKVVDRWEKNIGLIKNEIINEIPDHVVINDGKEKIYRKEHVRNRLSIIYDELCKLIFPVPSSNNSLDASRELIAVFSQNLEAYSAKCRANLDRQNKNLGIVKTGNFNMPEGYTDKNKLMDDINHFIKLLQLKLNVAQQKTSEAKIIADSKDEIKIETCNSLIEDTINKLLGAEFLPEAIHNFDLVNGDEIKIMEKIKLDISGLNKYLDESDESIDLSKMPLINKYTHSFLTFTTANTSQRTGDNFRVVGGCGMQIPDLETQPIQAGEAFALKAKKASPENAEETGEFEHNGITYKVFKMDVEDTFAPKHTRKEEMSDLEEALFGLEAMAADVFDNASLKPEHVKRKVDRTGATLIHYAAKMLSADQFQPVAALAPDQLVVADELGRLPIHVAAGANNVGVIEKIHAINPALVNAQTNKATTPLFFATEQGCLEAVKKLVALGANVNHLVPNGLFVLFIAIQSNYPELALYYINEVPGTNLSHHVDNGTTPLHLAIEMELWDVAAVLIAKGAILDKKRKTDGYTPMHCAVRMGRVDLVKVMLAKGFPQDVLLESKKSLLHVAAENGLLDMVNYLRTINISPELKTLTGETALVLAIKAGHVEVACVLSEVTSIDITNNKGQTASHLAVQSNMAKVGDALIRRGENPTAKDADGKDYVYAVVARGDLGRVENLMEGKKVDWSHQYGAETLLALAARTGHFLVAYELIDITAKYKTDSGLWEYHYAAMYDEFDYIEDWLSRNSLNKKIGDKNSSLAQLAARHGSLKSLKVILKLMTKKEVQNENLLTHAILSRNVETVDLVLGYYESKVSILDNAKNTAVHMIAVHGCNDMVTLLTSRGYDFTLRNKKNQTPFHIAIEQNDGRMLSTLFEAILPPQWPNDIWEISKECSMEIRALLRGNRSKFTSSTRTFNKVVDRNLRSNKKQFRDEVPNQEDVLALTELMENSRFDKIVDDLAINKRFVQVFNSPQGAKFFSIIIDRVKSFFGSVSEEERLLIALKDAGVDPARYRGEGNVLNVILSENDEMHRLYRLNVLAEHFPESMVPIALDEYMPGISYMSVALSRSRIDVFGRLDELCAQNGSAEKNNFYPLHDAVRYGNYEVVKGMLSRHSANTLNKKRATPLMIAAANDDIPMMELLIAHGAIIDKLDLEGDEALLYAIDRKREAAALYILPLLKEKNRTNRKGIRPLTLAALRGLLSVVRYYCEEADYSQDANKDGETALHFAARSGNVDVITYLVSKGYDINQSEKSAGITPIHLAALSGHAKAVAVMLSLGADPKKEDAQGNTLVEYAVMSNDSEMLVAVQQLPSYHEKSHDTRLLLAAAEVNNVEVLSELILDGINLNAVDENGRSALHIAGLNNSGDFAEMLAESDAVNLDAIDVFSNTPFQSAAKEGHVQILAILLHFGASIDKTNKSGLTALFMAAIAGHLGAVALLLKHKADMTITSHEGLTPTQGALLHGHINVVRQMLEAGDTSLRDEKIKELPKQVQTKVVSLRDSIFTSGLVKGNSNASESIVTVGK